MDMTALLPALEAVAFERLPDRRFIARGGVPTWCTAVRPNVDFASPIVLEDVFPFLTVFLPEAERAWGDASSRAPVESDLWTEGDHRGRDVHLRGAAVRVGVSEVLVVLRSDQLFLQHQSLLQRARELRMVHGSLMKQIEQKDIVVHAVVHDLVAPLHTILGILSLLGERPREEPEAGLIQLGIDAAKRQRDLIGEILDIFVVESGGVRDDVHESVDLSDVLRRVVAEREPVARSRGVRIEVTDDGTASVVAEEMRLFRVLTNLLDNALRYAASVVRIRTRREDAVVMVHVEDDGAGVPLELISRLFEKLAHGRDGASGTGLGLFFCRITVESWGGGIGYEKRPEGGSRFWIRLKGAPRRTEERTRKEDRAHGEAPHAG